MKQYVQYRSRDLPALVSTIVAALIVIAALALPGCSSQPPGAGLHIAVDQVLSR